MFEGILLEREQEELLERLVEAARNVAREDRQKFLFVELAGGTLLSHPGLPKGQERDVYEGDIEALAHEGLLAVSYTSSGTLQFDVTPLGFRYYEEIKRRLGEPLERVEASVTRYLSADRFRRDYSEAYGKWREAEALLWSTDSASQLTTIGHLCREALQEFVAALVQQYQPPDVNFDKSHTVARMRSILHMKCGHLGDKEQKFLDALVAYWGTVSDLTQRQEHAGKKEGEPLTWEDGRRLVFQTAVVMFEVARAVARCR